MASAHGQRTRTALWAGGAAAAAAVPIGGVLGGQAVGSAIEGQERDDGLVLIARGPLQGRRSWFDATEELL